MPLSDEAVICTWMEPKPPADRAVVSMTYRGDVESDGGWWFAPEYTSGHWQCRHLTLDALWEVESRLSEEQRIHYMSHIGTAHGLRGRFYEDAWAYIHADAPTRIKALASVLRSEVEK